MNSGSWAAAVTLITVVLVTVEVDGDSVVAIGAVVTVAIANPRCGGAVAIAVEYFAVYTVQVVAFAEDAVVPGVRIAVITAAEAVALEAIAPAVKQLEKVGNIGDAVAVDV